MSHYPFIHNLHITSVSVHGNKWTVQGTMNVYFSKCAWSEFGYKDGNFYWFNLWWQNQTGKEFCFGGIKAKLLWVNWTLIRHTDKYDSLGFKFEAEVKPCAPCHMPHAHVCHR